MKETCEFKKKLTAKWGDIIKGVKDGKSKAVRRDTAIIGVNKPFGTITRNGADITFVPAKSMRIQGFTEHESSAAAKLCDLELVASFMV